MTIKREAVALRSRDVNEKPAATKPKGAAAKPALLAGGKPFKTTEMQPPAGSRGGAASGGGGKTATKAAAKRVAAKAVKPRKAIAKSAVRKPEQETTRATKR
jgi:hypothetical protein